MNLGNHLLFVVGYRRQRVDEKPPSLDTEFTPQVQIARFVNSSTSPRAAIFSANALAL
jgi:hypothetical protein